MKRMALAVVWAFVASGCERGDRLLERMVDQPKVKSSGSKVLSAPGGTVSREEILGRPDLTEGTGRGYPIPLTRALLERGRNRFDIYCAACHGIAGTGDTPVADHMTLRQPPSLHEARLVALNPAQIYRVIHLGYGFMGSYDLQLSVEDRWAVVAYVKALQMSRSVPILALPASLQREAKDALQ